MDEHLRQFIKGYACATATLARLEGGVDVRVQEIMDACGLTLQSCRAWGVDEYDIEALFPEAKIAKAEGQTKEVEHG